MVNQISPLELVTVVSVIVIASFIYGWIDDKLSKNDKSKHRISGTNSN